MRIYLVIGLTLVLLAGLACGNADEARQEGYDQGIMDGKQTVRAYQRTLYDYPTATPSATPAEATARPAKMSLVPLAVSPAPTGYDRAALDKCITRLFGSSSYGSSVESPLIIARYKSLSPPEQQVLRHLVRNSGSDSWIDCSDWLTGGEDDS